MPKLIDLTGKIFGRLTVLSRAPNKKKHTMWNVVCECGTKKSVSGQNLGHPDKKRRIVSCGCYHSEIAGKASTTHGASKSPEMVMFWQAKKRAKLRGIEFSIDPEDVEIPDVCPLLGIKLVRGNGVLQHSSPSLDRINSGLGYIKGNVWVVSYRANAIKNDATIEEFSLLLDNWRSAHNVAACK